MVSMLSSAVPTLSVRLLSHPCPMSSAAQPHPFGVRHLNCSVGWRCERSKGLARAPLFSPFSLIRLCRHPCWWNQRTRCVYEAPAAEALPLALFQHHPYPPDLDDIRCTHIHSLFSGFKSSVENV
ncbi:hypothetical protein U1Q18_022310 [Sarracenia purpurea var. burkii]